MLQNDSCLEIASQSSNPGKPIPHMEKINAYDRLDTFVTYVVFTHEERRDIEGKGYVDTEYTWRSYLGLRERKGDALSRRNSFERLRISNDTHVFLKIVFYAAGFIYYSTTSKDVESPNVPTLLKMLYPQNYTDWKTWHFNNRLHLPVVSQTNVNLVQCEWEPISMDLTYQ